MSLQLEQINLGTAPLGKDGDTQRGANSKINSNMTAIQTAVNGKVDLAGGAFTGPVTFSGEVPWDSGNLPSPAQTTGTDFTGPVSFSVRPTVAGKAIWDAGNLPNPVQTTGGTFTGGVVMQSGLALSQANGGIELGNQAAANTPFVDFHSSGGPVDCDVRLIASGGSTSTPGKGTLSLLAANFVLGAANLQLSGYANSQWPLWFKNGYAGATSVIVFSNSGGATVGSIGTSDTATTFYTTSDYRLKQNYAPINGALESLRRIGFYAGEFKADPGKIVDYCIAHEVQEEMAFVVSGSKDAVQEYPILREGADPHDVQPDDVVGVEQAILPQAVDYSKMVPRLGAAIQELDAMLQAAYQRIAQLESRMP
ncbi:hypothetical protein [Ralstonia sp. UBA689]|uniref:hypothetical protein n=1 Tax=Ralstonia sp. UBA689 TaxID=1947373 RepID=UPI0025D2294B|nr:hypothetical protein [Ralstonia sp. UBA689]